MHNKNQLEQKTSFTQYQIRLNDNDYIIFNPAMTKQIYFLQDQSVVIHNSEKQLKEFYDQIVGYKIKDQKYICYDKQQLANILRNILILGGQEFIGSRIHRSLDGCQICLNLDSISSINFKNLRQLSFSGCKLVSIQAIAWLDIQNVKTIQLYQNNIVSVKPFNKTCLINLILLDLSFNKPLLNQFDLLQRSHSFRLQQLQIYKYKVQKMSLNLQDFRPFVKSQIVENREVENGQNNNMRLVIYTDTQTKQVNQSKWKMKINQSGLVFHSV